MSTYKDAGVDIDAADDAKRSMKKAVDRGDKRVLNTLGAFASLVEGSFAGYTEPILALKTEEPGTKQKLAFDHGYERSICFDTINHLVNDIVVMGALPLYAQDLILCGKMEKATVTKIVEGFADACAQQGCVLTGGETTEQPGVLQVGTYALAASIVGIVEKSKIIDGSAIQKGDTVLAVASSGLHTNGYTLVRSLMEKNPSILEQPVGDKTFMEAIMEPHRCYLKGLKDILTDTRIHGMAHITGGGMQGNINRILPSGTDAVIDLSALEIPAIFKTIRDAGNVEDSEMLKTFNMGVGLAMVLEQGSVSDVQAHLQKNGYESFVIGTIAEGNQTVRFEKEIAW